MDPRSKNSSAGKNRSQDRREQGTSFAQARLTFCGAWRTQILDLGKPKVHIHAAQDT